MGQQEILNLLKKDRKKWLSTKQIEQKLNVTSVSTPLNRLLKSKEVLQRKMISKHHYMYEWKLK